jgi:hypothetical protein
MTTVLSLTPEQLNTRLIPTFLEGKTLAQQYTILAGTSTDAVNFKKLAPYFYIAAQRAYNAKQKGTCTSPYRVPWTTSSGKFLLGWKSLANYFPTLLATPSTGFPALLFRVNYLNHEARRCQTTI